MDSLHLQIALGAYNNTGNLRQTAEINDLVIDNLDHFEGVAGGDGVYEDIAMDPDRVLRIQRRIFVLEDD